MPELKWIGKDKVINHDGEVPFHLLKEREELSVNSNNTENLLIKGDNLLALKSLLPYYYNKIKCIYIDPPYNTGNEKWVYNDNVNSPEMKKWIGNIVGSEGEDLCRHDKWLCMMYPRLKLLKYLLRDDGVMFISIDDNEIQNLKQILYEIFGEKKVDTMIWRKSGDGRYGKMKHTTTFRKDHEYIIVVYKNVKYLNKIKEIPNFQNVYGNPDKDPRGPYKAGSISRREDASDPNSKNYYTVVSPSGKLFTRQFEIPKEEFEKLNNDILLNEDGKKVSRIYWGKKNNAVPAVKVFTQEVREITPYSILLNKGTTYDGKVELRNIFNLSKKEQEIFPNPKPSSLLETLIQLATEKDDIILDSFAGSGTTGQAVLSLNNKDGYNRKFILVELEDGIANKVTAERLKRVIKGYSYNSNHIEGLGGGFKFMELDKPLFNKYKKLIGETSYEELESYIYFTETYQTINWKKFNKDDWYLGENKSTHYFLIYETKVQNELGENFLEIAQKYEGNKIVYSDVLMLDDEILNKYNIEFKQIPYEIKTF